MNIELIKTLKILYVEDEIALRDITSSSIESIISKLVVADNGKEGLDKFINDEFDLVITDLSMPVMDGISMIKEIRKINATVPIVVTTAFGITIAVPALIFHRYFRGKINDYAIEMEQQAIKLLEVVSVPNRRATDMSAKPVAKRQRPAQAVSAGRVA